MMVAHKLISKTFLIRELLSSLYVGKVLFKVKDPLNGFVVGKQIPPYETFSTMSILYSGNIASAKCGLTFPSGTLSLFSTSWISSLEHQLSDLLVLVHRDLLYHEITVDPGLRAVSVMLLRLLEFRYLESLSRNKPTLSLCLRNEQ